MLMYKYVNVTMYDGVYKTTFPLYFYEHENYYSNVIVDEVSRILSMIYRLQWQSALYGNKNAYVASNIRVEVSGVNALKNGKDIKRYAFQDIDKQGGFNFSAFIHEKSARKLTNFVKESTGMQMYFTEMKEY